MEVFELIKTGNLLQSIHDTCAVFIGLFSFLGIILFAVFMAMLEEDVSETLKKNIVKCIIGAIVGLVISIICVNAIPSASSYYLEAKIKVTKLQNISDKQTNALIAYLDYMILKTE